MTTVSEEPATFTLWYKMDAACFTYWYPSTRLLDVTVQNSTLNFTAMKTSDLKYVFFLFHLIWNTLHNTQNCNVHPLCVFITFCVCTETSLNERTVASFGVVKLDLITHQCSVISQKNEIMDLQLLL
jgi:hypothetical protein